MQIAKVLWERMILLFSTNPANLALAEGDQPKIMPIIAPFAASLNLVLADLTLDQGSAFEDTPSILAEGDAQIGNDPANGERMIAFKSTIGTFTHLSATPLVAVTIYGFALVDVDETVLYAVAPMANPVTLTAPGQLVFAPPFTLRFPPSMVR